MAESSLPSGSGFFGGLSTGIGAAQENALAQQKQQLAQRKQDAEDANGAKAEAAKQIDATIQHIGELSAAAAKSGSDPRLVLNAAQPLIASAVTLAERAGIDPKLVTSRAQAATMPVPPDEAAVKPVSVKPGDSLVHPQSGKVIYQAPPLDPVTGKPTGQPSLTPSDNPPQSFAPPPGTPAPVSAAPASLTAPDGTPAQTVAARFPSPDGGAQPAPAKPTGPMMPPGMEPGSPAIDYAIKNNITGPEFLKAVPLQQRNTVEGITDYKVDPDKLSKRVDKSGQSEYTRMLSWAHQKDPNYDPKYYKPMQKALTEFTSGGAQSPAGKITAGNTAIAHLGTLADAYDKMQEVPGLLDKIAKSNTSIASYAASRMKNEAIRGTSEGAALAAFLDARERYSSEIENYYAGGKGADAAIQRSIHALDAAYAPAEMYSALNAESHLLSGKVGALQERWKTSQAGPRFGDALFRNAIPDFPLLSADSERSLDRISRGFIAIKTKDGKTSGGNVQTGAPVDYRTYFGGQ